jgi:hypothetical protein
MDRGLLFSISGSMRALSFATLLALASAGCITPTIPIPPPDPTEMMGHFTVVGSVSTVSISYPTDHNYCGGIAYLYDRALQSGVIHAVNGDCSVGPLVMPATTNDPADFTVQVGQQTVSTCVRLQEGAQSAADFCP